MNTRILVSALLLVPAFTIAAQKPAEQKPAEQKPAEQKPAESKKSLTGAISEAEFKKLHELKKDVVPPRKGTMIEIAKAKAYLSLPAGMKAPLPGVVVIHEWWGLNENVMYWTDRLAAEGYAAVAVDLYDGTVATTPAEAMGAMRKVDEKRATEIMLAALRFLKEDPRVQAKKRASIGWCFGGGMSLKLALAAPDLDAAVLYYGHPETEAKTLEMLKAPLLAIYGTKDKSIPSSVVKEFDEALTNAKKEHKVLSYDADHAFANPSNPHYDEKNAGAAWAEVRAFLAGHLKPAKEDAKAEK